MVMFQKKNDIAFLTIDKGNSILKKYDQVFAGIKHHIKQINDIELGNKFSEVNYNTDYDKIKFLTDDSLPLNKLMYFPTLTVVIRYVLNKMECFIHKFI